MSNMLDDDPRTSTPRLTDRDLLERAVRNARAGRHWHYRWVAVMYSFGLGSDYAHVLCRRFGLDPDEKVRG